MVKKIFTLVLLIACSINFIKGQDFEYIVEKIDDVPSYFYTEKRGKIIDFLSSRMMIQVVNNMGYGVPVNIFFVNSADYKDTVIISTDSSGLGYISKKMFENGKFSVPPKGNLLNGIEGWVNIRNTRKLTIVLGQQPMSMLKIKSNSELSIEDIRHIVDSLRKGEEPYALPGITIDFIIEI